MKKVSEQERRDRSAAAVPGAASGGTSDGVALPVPSGAGGLGDALAAALSKRNKKVSASGKLHVLFVLNTVISDFCLHR